MVMAGHKNKNNQGANSNKPSNCAYPLSMMLYVPGITHNINPVANKKTPITKYPVTELKNDDISFLSME
jgi:hypothetical protein